MESVNNEWIEDTEKIIAKNKKREVKFLFVMGGYLFFSFLFIKEYYIPAFIALFLGIIIPLFIPKKIKLATSDMLALDLYKLSMNIEKYNGKNPHFIEEAKNNLTNLDIDINDYLREKKKLNLVDFNEEKNKEFLLKLQTGAKRVHCFFREYNKYKDKQEDIKEIIRKLALSFHENEKFADDAYHLISGLDEINIPKMQIRVELKPIIKKYLIESRLIYWLLFIILFPLAVWYLPVYTTLELTEQNRLIIIIPVLAFLLIQILTPSQKVTEKK